ncbi:MAG: 4Fe-4S dicluster domain-containing protein [Ruminococcaceae bacterium]|nr:4Fe-4S dicluster domain-containing protein [Oscillospiraceae bacterium]
MKNTVLNVPADKCTGCGACYNKCPVKAIKMLPNSEGFLFPNVDSEKCIDCGLCLKSCPAVSPSYENNTNPSCYAVMGSDELRSKSTSGGVFTMVAEHIISNGGVVCGAAYTDDFYGVEHIFVENVNELAKLRGSKYVQSDIGDTYLKTKEFLEQGRSVLYVGTPCQIAGLNAFLGKEYDNLYTMDLLCHGAPSASVYKKFITEREEEFGAKATRVAFRDKSVAGWTHCIKIEFANGTEYKKTRDECVYLRAFLKLLTVRKSCGTCPFAKLPRQGDITVADFWGIGRLKEELNDNKGTSLVLFNNNKAEKLASVIEKDSKVFEPAPIEHAKKFNSRLHCATQVHKNRERFFELLGKYDYSFSKAVDYGMNRKFDIGYIGWWYGGNYGSVLTNYALHQVLVGMKKSVLMLEWPYVTKETLIKSQNNKTRVFTRNFYETSAPTTLEQYPRFNNHCDTFLVGSDQLWNWYSNKNIGTYNFFLDFVEDSHKKIAYSTSFGHESPYYPKEMRLKLTYLLNRFDAISVREDSAIDVCKRNFDSKAVQTIDPVFLCSMEDYEKAAALSKVKTEKEYVIAYILDPTKEKIEAVRKVASELGIPYHIMLDGQGKFEDKKALANDPNVVENVQIADWLKYFKNSSYVVTDSFHGYCYSIIFGKSMSVFPNHHRGVTRFANLSRLSGLEDRCSASYEEFLAKEEWKKPVDFEKVREYMKPMIDYSYNWLKNALDAPKQHPSAKEILYKTVLNLQETIDNIKK